MSTITLTSEDDSQVELPRTSADYSSLPFISDLSTSSLLTQSQYAKVIFHGLLPSYPTDTDIWCRYTVTDGVKVRHGDRVALYRVGWSSVHDHVQFEMAPVPHEQAKQGNMTFEVFFRAESLPKDPTEFYQLCYVNVNSSVCGASVPFQFYAAGDDELCEVEEEEGLMVVRSRTAINQDKLIDAMNLIGELEKKNYDHEQRILDLQATKEKMCKRLDELSDIQKHEERLKKDIQALDAEKNEAFLKLHRVERHMQQLSATIEALNGENVNLNNLLRTESQKKLSDTDEMTRLRTQLDNLQQMLNAAIESKEVASHALRSEQSKVMKLNIEHDKYKYRSQYLEEQNTMLQHELDNWRQMSAELKSQVEQNLGLIHAKSIENDNLTVRFGEMTTQVTELNVQLERLREKYSETMLQLEQKNSQLEVAESQVSVLKVESSYLVELRSKHEGVERQLAYLQDENVRMKELQRANKSLQEQLRQVLSESTAVQLLEMENKALRVENLTYSKCKVELQALEQLNVSLNQQLSLTKANEASALPEDAEMRYNAMLEENASLKQQLNEVEKAMELQCKGNSTAIRDASANHQMSEMAKTEREIVSTQEAIEQLANYNDTLSQDTAFLKGRLAEMSRSPRDDLSVDGARSDVSVTNVSSDDTVNGESKPLLQSSLSQFDFGNFPLSELRDQLTAAEGSSALLLADFQQIGCDPRQSVEPEADLALAMRIMELQNQKANKEIQLEEIKSDETASRAKLQGLLNRLEEIDVEMARLSSELASLSEKSQVDQNSFVFINERMEILQAQVLRDDEKEGMMRETNDQERLGRMSKRSYDLQCRIANYTSAMHDAKQDLLVLRQEQEALKRRIERAPQVEQERSALKCRTLEELVELDRRVMALRVELYRSKEAATSLCPTSAEPKSGPQFETAVAKGVSLGFRRGMDALRQVAEDSMASVDLEMVVVDCPGEGEEPVDQRLLAKEGVVKERLTEMLETTVRKGLLGGKGGGESSTERERELKLRLELAAEEYRKVYVEKLRAVRRLNKLQQRRAIGLEAVGDTCVSPVQGYICPICSITFPMSANDLFKRHYEDHINNASS